MAMTQPASTCLSLLFLLSSFPLSLGVATHIGGASLIGVTSVSEILDQFFKKRELAGRAPPAWKREAQAMISFVQNLKDINATTQGQVDEYVKSIIETLKSDVANTKVEQGNGRTTLDLLKKNVVSDLENCESQLTKVKDLSAKSKSCRDDVATQKEDFYKDCTDNDADGAGASSSSSMSLLEVGGSCPKECGKPSTADFELTSQAKKTYQCDFAAGETSKQCVDRLWGEVNKTRAELTTKYNTWSTKKKECEAHMARCAKCNPLWNTMVSTITQCDGKRDVMYGAYCVLQTEQTDFCTSSEDMHTQWTTVHQPAQEARVSEYSDLEFIICIFESYLKEKTFTKEMIESCPKKGPGDFYKFADGELSLPVVNGDAVPKCSGAVAHKAGSPLFDMSGFIAEITTDGLGTDVSVDNSIYSPDASKSSVFCGASTK